MSNYCNAGNSDKHQFGYLVKLRTKKLSEFYQISKFLSNNGTFNTRRAAAHISVNLTMEFSNRHLAHFTPAVQVGWNQFKPVGSSLVRMTNRNSMALLHHFCFGLQQGRLCNSNLSGLKLSVNIANPCSKLLCTEVREAFRRQTLFV